MKDHLKHQQDNKWTPCHQSIRALLTVVYVADRSELFLIRSQAIKGPTIIM